VAAPQPLEWRIKIFPTPIPEGVNLPGLEDARAIEATCGFIEEQCQTGFCNPETCAKFETEATKEACGCEEIEI